MLAKIRIGNDLVVDWVILDIEGNPYNLDGKELKVFMDVTLLNERRILRQEQKTIEVTDFTHEDNVISFTYPGMNQEYIGIYALRFVENDMVPNMVTFDEAKAFELVSHSWLEEQGDSQNIHVKSISIKSKVVVNGSSFAKPYLSIERLFHHLYKVSFDNLPEDNGSDNDSFGLCSAYVQNGKLHRNLDFKFDDAATFKLVTSDFEAISFITGLNDGKLKDSLIAQLPYRLVDGENKYGIMVSVHVLFNDWEWSGCGNRSIQLTRLPFLILSKVKSMATISDDLSDVLSNLSSTPALDTAGYLLQCLVTDGTTTYAVVPPDEDGASYVLVDATSNPKMSNFRYVNRSEVSRYDMDIQVRPTGIERFNMMPCELEDLRFTAAYETPDRLSEFIGIRGTTKSSTDEELEEIYDDAHTLYLDRQRDGSTWHTMHSVVYGNGIEHLHVQENWKRDFK